MHHADGISTPMNSNLREKQFFFYSPFTVGTLVKHRVQNRDIQKVYETFQNPTKDHKTLINELKSDGVESQRKNLITEIDTRTLKALTKGKGVSKSPNISTKTSMTEPTKKSIPADTRRKPDYRLFKTTSNDKSYAMIAEFFLPEVMARDEIDLSLGRDRLALEARRAGYLFDSFFPFDIDVSSINAQFDNMKHVSLAYFISRYFTIFLRKN